MSRPNSELLPVLCVPIDPRQCVGPSLGPRFTVPTSLVEARDAAGHLIARGITGRSKNENIAYNDLVRIADEIDAMVIKSRFDPDRVYALLIEERADLIRFAIERATRKNQPPPLWAVPRMQKTVQGVHAIQWMPATAPGQPWPGYAPPQGQGYAQPQPAAPPQRIGYAPPQPTAPPQWTPPKATALPGPSIQPPPHRPPTAQEAWRPPTQSPHVRRGVSGVQWPHAPQVSPTTPQAAYASTRHYSTPAAYAMIPVPHAAVRPTA